MNAVPGVIDTAADSPDAEIRIVPPGGHVNELVLMTVGTAFELLVMGIVPPPEPASFMVRVCVDGDPSVAPPIGAESDTVKDVLPVAALSFRIGTVKDLFALSPSAQLRLPDAIV